MIFRILSCLSLLLVTFNAPLHAQEREVPYWASIKTEELNMRVGPSREYKISWVYKRERLPIKVIRVVEGWRLVQDSEGTQGWVTASLLSPRRTALVVGEGLAPMRDTASKTGDLKWNLEAGVVGYLGDCSAGWCEFDASGYTGWVSQSRLWGSGEP